MYVAQDVKVTTESACLYSRGYKIHCNFPERRWGRFRKKMKAWGDLESSCHRCFLGRTFFLKKLCTNRWAFMRWWERFFKSYWESISTMEILLPFVHWFDTKYLNVFLLFLNVSHATWYSFELLAVKYLRE